jgi:IPT/TIG domain-containing protein
MSLPMARFPVFQVQGWRVRWFGVVRLLPGGSRTVRKRAAQITTTLLLSGILVALPGSDAAFAAAPTISSFSPTSGPVGTSVTIHGNNFSGPDVTSVTFDGASATFTIDNPQKITATVPTGATTGPIAVMSPDGTATSSTNFAVTTTGAPTITSFNPTSGPVGTSVRINGTNFTGATAVSFDNVNAQGFAVNGAGTRITVAVPTGATTGPIRVTTPSGTATSPTNFTVTMVVVHPRATTLHLVRHLVARGTVTSTDGFAACTSNVGVRIQRRRAGGSWRTVGTDQTNDLGGYRERIPDRVGLYRAVAVRETLNAGADICARDRSPTVRHRH